MNRRKFIVRSSVTAAGALAFAGCASAPAANPPPLLAGAARRRVTPPLWVPYLTSSGNGTHAPFQGVHDELFARALVLDDGHDAIALLAVDSIGYDNTLLGPGRDFTAELRGRVAAGTKLKPGALMLCATHSHSTPETIGLTPFRDVRGVPEWLENHLGELAATVGEAWRRRVPVRVRAGVTRVEGIARNRRILLKDGTQSRHGPLPAPGQVAVPWRVDEDLNVVCLERADGSPHTVLLNFTAHPIVTMLLPQVSADYPGPACALVERELPGSVCLFTQGAAGNINLFQVSTGFADAVVLGEKLGRAALHTMQELRRGDALPVPRVACHSATIQLTARDCPSLEELERLVASAPSAGNQRLLRLARKLREDALRAEVQAMRLGPVRWVSLPGEPFVETGFALKDAGAAFVVGYANGWLGYFPIRRAYDEGGYETNIGTWSRVTPGSAERLEAAGKELLENIRA
jgi:hypothetical protein